MYGTKGRIIAIIALVAGVLSAIVAAGQEAQLFTLLPEKYKWFWPALVIVALFVAGFSERIQGGASDPVVRKAAHDADLRKDEDEARIKSMRQQG